MLSKQIYAVLEHDNRIDMQSSRLLVTSCGRHILLEGEVDDIATKRLASNDISQMLGEGYCVIDLLRIRSGLVGDAHLRDKIAWVLDAEPVFRDFDISVETNGNEFPLRDFNAPAGDHISAVIQNGVVTLMGQVNSLTHRRLAEVLLWQIDGCQRIDNLIDVVPPQQDNDDELTDAVRLAFEIDPLIDATLISVAVYDRSVELGGLLPNDVQKNLAARDAWSVPDVREVHNRIEVGSA
jgi:osmotically-inducible protein OsmY